MRTLILFVFFFLIAGCAAYTGYKLDQQFGTANPSHFDQALPPSGSLRASVNYWKDVKPITDSRCAVCHGCFDAPCQLQMGSYQGITRGGNKDSVYATRLLEASPTRLFIDGQSTAEWRLKDFHPILNEREPEANVEASVMARLLRLKGQYHFPEGQPLPGKQFDFSLDRQQQCPAIEEFEDFAKDHPDWGMPYGLPALEKKSEQTLLRWLEAGAPAEDPKPLTKAYLDRIAQWETFLNGSTFKAQLMSRYIYEHWFLAHLYFKDLPEPMFFDLVRSKTPPGQPIQLIATRRPFDDPGVPRVYYRFRPVQATLVSKTHMPYALDPARMDRLKTWFLDEPYTVKQLPSYSPDVAANPFVAFQQIPTHSRYRLLLDEAQFTVMGFIKGPVCRGQVALNVINDYFWIGFVHPEGLDLEGRDFLAEALMNVRLPIERTNSLHPTKWRSYAKQEQDYLRAKSEMLNQTMVGKNLVNLNMLWDGDGHNRNAALTVFRHFDSATVVQGFLGERPQTALILGYPLLERIHYLLVAGFDIYGNVVHQLEARLYMDFLRMEGEMNALAFLPKDSRNEVRDFWYRNASDEVKAYLNGSKAFFYQDSGIDYKTDDPWGEFVGLWKQHLKPVMERRYDLSESKLAREDLDLLKELTALKGQGISYLPEASFLTVRDDRGKEHHFTLLRNSAHSNISEMFKEDNRRLPNEDTLTLANGFLGAYPNAFFYIDTAHLPWFVEKAGKLKSEADYAVLLSRYGIRRTDPRFWPYSDTIHTDYRKTYPVEAGLFDYNRFENR